jgi:hypothetical protein
MNRLAPGRAHHTQDEQQTTAEKPAREANLIETRLLGTPGAFFLMLFLAACGGGGAGGPPPGLGTLAYVETQCRDTREGFVERQALRIRQGDREPITVFETPGVGPITLIPGLCWALTQGRGGGVSVAREALQSVAVSPDGADVAFEVTDEFSTFPRLPLHLPPDQKGIFWVRADGTGLRPLGPPPRSRFFFGGFPTGALSFSPNGRTIAFVDKGPDADGHEADQVVTIDVATGTRTQVTHLPPSVPPAGFPADAPTVHFPVFFDDTTINFKSCANPNGTNPDGTYLQMTIKTDGSGLNVPLPIPIAVGGGVITVQFVITGDTPQAIDVVVPGPPTNDPPLVGWPETYDLFVIDEVKNILQLTNYKRVDTRRGPVDVDREHIYFGASADPLGTNPSLNCQLFSIDRLGGNLRQLTNFRETEHSVWGCQGGPRPSGCYVYSGGIGFQDPRSRTVLFSSSCDPLGTNPNGDQIFAIQPDGSGLRQLTDSRGLVKEADGRYSGELPGPWAYGPYAP